MKKIVSEQVNLSSNFRDETIGLIPLNLEEICPPLDVTVKISF